MNAHIFLKQVILDRKVLKMQHYSSVTLTLSIVESFIESEVPYLRLFLILSIMPLKRWVATENVLTALLENEVQSKFFM